MQGEIRVEQISFQLHRVHPRRHQQLPLEPVVDLPEHQHEHLHRIRQILPDCRHRIGNQQFGGLSSSWQTEIEFLSRQNNRDCGRHDMEFRDELFIYVLIIQRYGINFQYILQPLVRLGQKPVPMYQRP